MIKDDIDTAKEAVKKDDIDKVRAAVKKLVGVNVHGKLFRLSFTFEGDRQHEPLKDIELTIENAHKASKLLEMIKLKIELGEFNYEDYFPNSSYVKSRKAERSITGSTLNDFIDKALLIKKEKVKDISHELSRVQRYVRQEIGMMDIRDIKYSHIETWRSIRLDEIFSSYELARLEKKATRANCLINDVATEKHELANIADGEPIIRLNAKTKNDILTPVREAFRLAYRDRIIDKDPMDWIANLSTKSCNLANPFTLAEIKVIGNTDTYWESERNGVVFACWTGLRLSEWLALSWDDIDLDGGVIHVKRCVVKGHYARPKTERSTRTVLLLDQAREVLLRQKELSGEDPSREIKVDNLDGSFAIESLKFVFTNSLHGEPWPGGHNFNRMFFREHLQRCGLEYRGGNQARHTYGSMMITQGLTLEWVAKEMGHTSVKTAEKHYAKWIPENRPNMAKEVSNLFK